jgi:hypothetical protein
MTAIRTQGLKRCCNVQKGKKTTASMTESKSTRSKGIPKVNAIKTSEMNNHNRRASRVMRP